MSDRAGDAVTVVLGKNWPTPNHILKAADAIDKLAVAKYGDILRAVVAGIEKAETPSLPTIPGHYESPVGGFWTLHRNGQWFAHGDGSLSALWATSEVAALPWLNQPVDRLEVAKPDASEPIRSTSTEGELNG